jgi:HEAT repeat protein
MALAAIVALIVFLSGLAGEEGKQQAASASADVSVLRQAGVGADVKSLLAYLSKHAQDVPVRSQVDDLVRHLGSEDFEERERTARRLVILGPAALPSLRHAKDAADPEVRRRALECIKVIEPERERQLAAVRLLARRAAEGTASVFLAYFGSTADEDAEETVWYALDAVVARQGKVEAACALALRDKDPRRRGAAAFLLARYGDARQRDQAELRLRDDEPSVRLRAAQGLLAAKDERGVPALIALLGSNDVAVCWQAEELLRWTAAEQSPRETIGVGSPDQRERCRAAWRAWWQRNEGRLNLRDREEVWRRPGLVLIGHTEGGRERTCTCLVGCDSVPRGIWVGPDGPVEARMPPGAATTAPLPNGGRLIANAGRVVTLNHAGKVIDEILCERDPQCVRPCFGVVRLGFDEPSLDFGFYGGHNGDTDVGVLARLRLQGMKSRDAWMRRRAAELFGSMSSQGVAGILALKEALDDPDEGVRRAAKEALSKVGADAVSQTLAQIRDKDGMKRLQAVDQLTEFSRVDIGAAAKLFAPALLDAMKDENAEVRGHAANTMVYMGLEAERVVPALIRALEDDHPQVRVFAVHSLGQLGSKAKSAVPALLKALRGKDLQLRHWTAASLGWIGAVDETVVPALIEALKDEHARSNAATALANIGPAAKGAIPALIEALDAPVTINAVNHRPIIRSSVVQSLGRFGPDSVGAVSVLVGILKDETESTGLKCDAIRALGRIGPAAQEATPLIQRLSRRGEPFVSAASEAIKRIDEKR